MTEIEAKALALVNEVRVDRGRIAYSGNVDRETSAVYEALCRAIEQHEAFKLEVSDAVKNLPAHIQQNFRLSHFILPKPDPLVEAVDELWTQDSDKAKYMADQLRAYLAARRLEIREVDHD